MFFFAAQNAHCYKIYKINLYSTSQIFVKPPKIKQMLNVKKAVKKLCTCTCKITFTFQRL